MSISIRIYVPLILFVMLAAQTGYMYYQLKGEIEYEIYQENLYRLDLSLRVAQDSFERLLRLGARSQIRDKVLRIGADPHIKTAVVIDDTNKVIASLSRVHLGDSIDSIITNNALLDEGELFEILKTIKTSYQGYKSKNRLQQTILGAYPVVIGASRDSLRPDRIGAVIILKDLSELCDAAEQRLINKLTPVAAVIILLMASFSALFYVLVGRRLAQLERVTVDIGSGNYSSCSDAHNNDEIGKLFHALNTMAIRIQSSQQKLSVSERQFQNLTECSPVGVYRTDLKGACIYVNQRWQDITGMTAEEAMGDGWIERIHPDDLKSLSEEWSASINQNRAFRHTYRFKSEQYGSVWVLGQTVLEYDEHGRNIGHIGTITDITDRKKYEHQLEQQSMVINQTHDSVISTDLEGFVTSWNKGAEKLFGQSMQDAIGRHISFAFPEDEKDFLSNRVMKPVLEKGSHEVEAKVQRCSGEAFFANTSLSLLRDPSGKISGIIFYLMDITFRKRAEEALSKSEASLSEAQRIAKLGNWTWNVVTDELQWSDEIYRIFGVSRQQFKVNRDAFFRLVHVDDRKNLISAFDDALYKQIPLAVGYRIYLPDSSIRYVHEQAEVRYDDNSKPLRVIGTIQDITDRVSAERAMKRSAIQFRSTFEQAAVGVAHVKLDGCFLLVNQRFCDVVGYSLDELMRFSVEALTCPDDLDLDAGYLKKLLDNSLQRYSVEKRLVTSNGTMIWTNFTVSLVLGDDNKPEYYIYVVEDISERRDAASKIARTLKEKEALLQELHHRVKNNMQVISSILSLQSRNINKDNIKRVFDESRQRIKTMALIHERLYTSGDLSHIDIKGYLDYLAVKIKSLYGGSGKQATINVEGETIRLPVDTALPVALIVNELLTNAIYHAYPENEDAKIDISLISTDAVHYQIRVRDYGVGFTDKIDHSGTNSSGMLIIQALSAQIYSEVQFTTNNGTSAILTIPVPVEAPTESALAT